MTIVASNPQERRDFIRLKVDMPVLLEFESGKQVMGRCLDISGGGAKLVTQIALPAEQVFRMILKPDSTAIASFSAAAQLRWSQENSGQFIAGVEFEKIL